MRSKELTWQSCIGALIVSAIIATAYPYIVLKLGMGPNVSVLAAFLGALFLLFTARATRGMNARMNNVIQTAATSAASTAFMCVVAAAFGYLAMNESVEVKTRISGWQMFTWLSLSGTIGVLVAALFRRYFIEDPEMIFADGVAAAETINVLDGTGEEGGRKMRVIGVAAGLGFIVAYIRDGLQKLATLPVVSRFSIGVEWSPLSFGTGLLLTLNVGLSMLAGTAIVALFGPTVMQHAGLDIVRQSIAPSHLNEVMAVVQSGAVPADSTQLAMLKQHGGLALKYLRGAHFSIIMLWFMWPATALMITASLTAVLLKWRSIAAMFRSLSARRGNASNREDVSLRTIIWLTVVLAAALAFVQWHHFGMPAWQTALSIVFSLPLILVGVRVLGEMNQGPVSLMANGVQALFRLFSPHIGHNLVAAGMSGDINSQGEGTMQVYKTGKLVGSTPRILTWVQFCSIPIGAAAVAIMYPILVKRFVLGEGLVAPTGLKLANMAVLMAKGFSAFPPGALAWTVVAAVAGIFLTLAKDVPRRKIVWLPSAAAFGFALILPGTLNLPIALGTMVGWCWMKLAPGHYDRHHITVASGFIGGEALIAGVILPVLFYFGVLRQ